MRRLAPLIIALVGIVALPALAQDAPKGTPIRVRGAVDKLDGNTLTVKTKDGPTATVALANDVLVFAMAKITLADIKPGDAVASTGIKGADGKMHAIEVRVLPKPFADGGRQFPWDLMPDSVMTNATVGTITATPDGAVFHVTFKEGEADYTAGPDTILLSQTQADTSLLTPGKAVVVFALKHDDGSLSARALAVEKDGIKPPM
ncbi:MAG TPA: hypothetical protein VGR70_20950 [Stellaceae bacterium]|nr:hypothetical protein [Stellaceae bacterium]